MEVRQESGQTQIVRECLDLGHIKKIAADHNEVGFFQITLLTQGLTQEKALMAFRRNCLHAGEEWGIFEGLINKSCRDWAVCGYGMNAGMYFLDVISGREDTKRIWFNPACPTGLEIIFPKGYAEGVGGARIFTDNAGYYMRYVVFDPQRVVITEKCFVVEALLSRPGFFSVIYDA